MTVEFCGCDPRTISDPAKVEAAFLDAARYSGAHVVNWSFHRFNPQGVSGFVIISESHFSIHAWPEHDYAAVDIFTCGSSVSHDKAVSRLKELLGAREAIISSDMCRGTVFKGVGRCPGFGSKEGHGRDCVAGWENLFKKSGAYGMLCAVDVNGIDAKIVSDEAAQESFLEEIAALMGVAPGHGPFERKSFGNGNACLSGIWESASIKARFDAKTAGAYLELFSRTYFEPRECGERAVETLKGGGYRLHLALRM